MILNQLPIPLVATTSLLWWCVDWLQGGTTCHSCEINQGTSLNQLNKVAYIENRLHTVTGDK